MDALLAIFSKAVWDYPLNTNLKKSKQINASAQLLIARNTTSKALCQ